MKARKGKIARRAGPRSLVIELLEDRALLSVMALSTSPHLAPLDGSQGAGEVGSGAGVQNQGRVTTANTGGNNFVMAQGADNNANVSFQDPPAVGRNQFDGVTRETASNQQVRLVNKFDNIDYGNTTSQPIIIQTFRRSVSLPRSITTPSLITAGGDFAEVGAEDLGTGGGGGLASQDGVNLDLVGWATIAPSGGGSPSPDWSGRVISLTGRTGDGPGIFSLATVAPGLVISSIRGVEHPGHASPGLQTPPESPHDRSVPVPSGETGTSKETRVPGWGDLRDGAASFDQETRASGGADLLDGAAALDWDLLDRDLRQFLSRFGGLQGALDGCGGGAEWPLWIAVLTALFVARQAAHNEASKLRRLAAGAGPAGTAPARSPGPPGPWPLGLS